VRSVQRWGEARPGTADADSYLIICMVIFPPSKHLASYVEAYNISSYPNAEWPIAVYPAISTCYIKVSSTTAVISGQATQPTEISSEAGRTTGLSVKLRVGGFYRLFGIPACELTNRVIQLDELLGFAADEILERVAEEENPTAWVMCFERLFLRMIQQRANHVFPAEDQVVSTLRKKPKMSFSELAEKYGYSTRQMQRRLNDYIGLSPRLYKCIYRFEHALDLIQRSANPGKIDWAAFALSCGYSDQAHFIREFRRFTGSTPAFFQASR
jgi:AraC-like DNA-binding protein